MSFPLVIIAGAGQALFDALSAQSANLFSPNGALILRPTPDGLSSNHASVLIEAARVRLKTLAETVAINTVVLAVTQEDEEDQAFRAAFFPFALYRRVNAPDLANARSKNIQNRVLNTFVIELQRIAVGARHRADLVKGAVSKANMSALILPTRNFRREELLFMLHAVFDQAATVDDLDALLRASETEFSRLVPFVTPPGADRRCYCDGRHYFKSPGRHRHGFYQNSKDGAHGQSCLLNARSRLGGALLHDFHFDCQPVKRLDARYPDCHDAPRPPREKHVNIAPSDGII